MIRTKSPRVIASRAAYLEDCALYGVARADDLARIRQLNALDPLKISIAEEAMLQAARVIAPAVSQ